MAKIVEVNVDYEEDIIIFREVSEDPWNEGTYYMTVSAYRPMYLADNSVIRHPFAYENAEAYQFARRKQYGFTSFIAASEMAEQKAEQYMRKYGGR